MNGKYRDFMQKQNGLSSQEHNSIGNGDSMRQLFGNSPDNPSYHEEEPKEKIKKTINVENIPVPVSGQMIKKGFIAMAILFIVQACTFVFYMKFIDFIGAVLITTLSFLFAKKVQYRYTEESNFFFYNFTVTLKGVLNHYRATSILFNASEKIFIYSIGLMVVQHFLLSWFSLSSILYSIGYYGMFLGIILNIAKRKTELLYKGLFLYSSMLAIMSMFNSFGSYHYLNYHTAISLLIFWYLGGFFQSLNISEVHIDTKSKHMQKDVYLENDDELI